MSIEARRWCVALVTTAVIATIGILIADEPWLESLEYRSYHARFHLRRERKLHPDVRVVAIAQKDREVIATPWPWPRSIHAQMLQVLSYYEAASVAWDIVFRTPREGDEALTKAAVQTPRSVFGYFFQIEPGDNGESPPRSVRLEDHAIRPVVKGDERIYGGAIPEWPLPGLELPGQLGFLNVQEERGEVIIRVPLVIQCRGYLFPSLSLAALCQYLGVKPNAVEVAPNRSVRIESAQKGAFIIPIDRHGRMLINFYGGIRALEACTAHYSDVLAAVANGDPGRKLEDYKGKIVFIGGVDPLLKDLGTTPLATNFPMVGIHAFVVSNVLERSFVMRARHTTNRVLLFVFTFLVAGATARRSLRKGGLTAAVLVLAFGVAAHLCFAIGGLWINVVAPLGCMLSAYGAILTYRFFAEERERIRTRRWLVRYLSPDIVEEALQTPESLVFSGAMKKITVLLSDIRDFTPMTEELGPQMVVSMLNEYFTVMTRVVHKHGGSVNQFVGDEILAVFGAPVTKPDDARRALLTAVEMQAELQKLMSRWAEEGRRTFDIGMGLNTGEVVVGNIGSLEHMDYAVMGDTINYAARLESLTKTYKTRILLSHSTYEEVKDLVIAESLGHIQVKGRKNAEEVHKLIGLK